MRAPFDGIVSERAVSAGDVVQPGSPLFTVVDPSSMRLEAAVPADALTAVAVGTPVEFTVSGLPGRTFRGRVERVNPVADPATRQVRVYVGIPNAARASSARPAPSPRCRMPTSAWSTTSAATATSIIW